MIPKLMSHKVYIEELEKQIADLKDKLHRRNMQIKDLKKELQNIYEKNAYLND